MQNADIWFSPWVLGVLGLCIGSFLNVVIYRWPVIMEREWLLDAAAQLEDPDTLERVGKLASAQAKTVSNAAKVVSTQLSSQTPLTLSTPRSRCPQCGHVLAWHENIPLLGWLKLGGKCSSCKTAIPKRYPFIELLTGLLFALVALQVGPQPLALLWCGFVAFLIAMSGIDWDTTLLPDTLTLPLLWLGLLAAYMHWTVPLADAVLGAMAGYLSLWSVYWLFKKATGKEGMGYGDFKLLAALGAWLGWQMLIPIVLMSSVIGAVVGIAMKLSSSLREGKYVPFGPFLAGAGLVVMFAGQARVLSWLGWV